MLHRLHPHAVWQPWMRKAPSTRLCTLSSIRCVQVPGRLPSKPPGAFEMATLTHSCLCSCCLLPAHMSHRHYGPSRAGRSYAGGLGWPAGSTSTAGAMVEKVLQSDPWVCCADSLGAMPTPTLQFVVQSLQGSGLSLAANVRARGLHVKQPVGLKSHYQCRRLVSWTSPRCIGSGKLYL